MVIMIMFFKAVRTQTQKAQTQGEDGCLQDKKRSLRREQSFCTLNLDLQPPELRDDKLLLLSNLICGFFVLKPNQINTSVCLHVQVAITNPCILHST